MTDLVLPPLLHPIRAQNPFDTAIDHVRSGTAGAGDVYWAESTTDADFAIILEPEVNQQRTLEMLPLAMVALGDCLAVLLPPQVAVQFHGTQSVIVNGGVAGTVTAALAATKTGTDSPDWLVISIKLALKRHDDAQDPGFQPDITTLDEEGWPEPDLHKLIETYARHFLSWMAAWNDDGFRPVARAWKFKAKNESDPDLGAIAKNVTNLESTKPV